MDNPMFELNVYFMRLVGMYSPCEHWGFLRKCAYYILKLLWFIALLGGMVSNILRVTVDETSGTISDMAINILYIELFTSITLRAFYFATDSTDIDRLAEKMTTEFKHSSKFPFKPKTMDFIRLLNHWFFISWMAFVLIVGAIMSSTSLLKNPMELPYEIMAWYDTTTPLNFSLTLFVEFVSIELMLISYANLDMLNATFMLYITAQVDILAADFANIIHNALKQNGCSEDEIMRYMSWEDDDNTDAEAIKLRDKIENTLESGGCKARMIENLGYCAVNHQNILNFIDEYQSYISPYLLVEINFNFSYMIFMLFTIATTDSTSMYFSLCLYMCGCVAQIFLTMFLGDLLSSRVESMRHISYGIRWYMCDRYFLSSFKIVQIRMTKPVSITAGKLLSLTLDTFLEYIKKAFSFFSVLRQVT